MRFGKKGKLSPRFIDPYEVIKKSGSEGTQPGFPFSNSGDSPCTPTDSKKTNLSFCLNLFKSESVEGTHLYNYVFH